MSGTGEKSFLLFLHRNDVARGVGFTLYGIYLALFCVYLRGTVRHGVGSRAGKLLLAAMLLLLLSATAQFGVDMAISFKLGDLFAFDITALDLLSLVRRLDEASLIAGRWTTAINFVISDLIIIWRASVAGSRRRAVQLALWVVAGVDVVLAISAAALWTHDIVQNKILGSTSIRFNQGFNFVSLGATLAGTGTIAVAAWTRTRRVDPFSYTKIGRQILGLRLSVLVETGVMWALIQLLFAVQEVGGPAVGLDESLAAATIRRLALYLAAILPTAVVLIVRSRGAAEDPRQFVALDQWMGSVEEGRAQPMRERETAQEAPQPARRESGVGHRTETQSERGDEDDAATIDARGFAQQLRDMAERAALMLETRGRTHRASEEPPPDYRSQYTARSPV
ncbi:hypothetical protein FB451DRAFT_1565923 [Mycena latifolia]|nr:hypothetical protein FB451DRAFT_1565923 [Mycena latifolia]